MIRITVYKSNNHYIKLDVLGHANSDEYGKDLVCASVSTLSQTLVNSVELLGEISEKNLELHMSEGDLRFEIDSNAVNVVSDLLFENFMIGINGILNAYPQYVKLSIKEVHRND